MDGGIKVCSDTYYDINSVSQQNRFLLHKVITQATYKILWINL
jgi:hypothetical protein